jgi:hypothetical protein
MANSAVSSTPLNLFNVAQTFWVEPNEVAGSTTCEIAGVDIFFEYMPAPINNQSGLQNPGITLYMANTIYNVPQITANTFNQWARLEYNQIQTSSDASVPTRFIFNTPITVATGQLYALLLSYDGNETFVPWTAVSGWWEVGTRNVYTETNQLVGNFFEYASNDLYNNPTLAQTQAQYQSFWTPLAGTQMTFDVFVARYFINGVPVSQPSANVPLGTPIIQASFLQEWDNESGEITYSFPNPNMEGIAFSNFLSTFNTEVGAQLCYQNTVPYGGSLNPINISCNAASNVVVANTTMPNGTAFAWSNVFNGYTGTTYIVLNGGGANQQIARVMSVINATAIQIDSNCQFTNANSNFLLSAVGWVDSTLASSPFGPLDSFLFLINSSANSTVRFVNNQILSAVCTNDNGGYNNTDVLVFSGFENITGKVTGGYNATANIVTNGSGNISAIYMANLGCSFTNTANITATLNSANGGSSNGSGANVVVTIGAYLKTLDTLNTFANCLIMNIDIDDIQPYFNLTNPIGTTYTLDFDSLYYIQQDASTSSGFVSYANNQDFPLTLKTDNALLSNQAVAFVSRSNEFGICYANGTPAGLANALNLYSNSFMLNLVTTSNNDFLAVTVDSQPSVEMGKYIINNNYANDNTNNDSSYAQHVTTQITWNGLAEDIRVYITAYKPAFTDIEVYAKIQNSTDVEQFVNEQWTRLTYVDGSSNNQFSSSSDITNYQQLSFGFQPYPNSAFTIAGTVTTTNNSFTVTGLGTTFQANLSVGSMIKIYEPLFPSNYMITTVNSIATNTSMTVSDNINSNTSLNGNPNLIGTGLAVDVITYTQQAFNNALNDNVVRYYNSSLVKWDGYNNLQLKVVMLSSKLSYIPRINSIQCNGLSA